MSKSYSISKMTVTFLFYVICAVNGLSLSGIEEGPCNIPKPQENLNYEWVFAANPTFYVSAGSKYQLYRSAAGSPSFHCTRDFEFYYGYCPTVKFDFKRGILHSWGFGGASIGNYSFTLPDQAGIFYFIPQPPIPGAGQHVTAVLTLTDNKSFAFIYKCWNQDNQRGWDLLTISPTITPQLQREIEQHAVSLGFDRNQFQFVRYEYCLGHPYQQFKC